MFLILAQLALLVLATLPLILGTGLLCHRLSSRFKIGWSTSEQLIAVLALAPLAALAEIGMLGRLPFHRPLDWLPLAHAIVALLTLAWCFSNRSELLAWLQSVRTNWKLTSSELFLAARIVFIFGTVAFISAAAWGLWTTPIDQDAAGYHLPQAIQPWQDGRLGPVFADLVYADSYPRASTLLWFWTLAISRTDAGFDLTAAWFGLMLCLAGYIMARRAGAQRGLSLACAGLAPSVPMFAMLASIKQIDLHTSGLIAAAMAFSLPRASTTKATTTSPGSWPIADQLITGLCLVLAMWMKFLPIAMIALILGFRLLLTLASSAPPSRRLRDIATLALWAVAVALASCGPYVQTWLQYGTPVYPYQLELFGFIVFDGPLSRQMISGESAMAWADRFRIFWIDWTHPLGPQQPSGFGPIWPFVLLPVCVLFSVAALAGTWPLLRAQASASRSLPQQQPHEQPAWLALAALTGLSLLAALVLPHHHWPRYTLWLVPLGSACLAVLLSAAGSGDGAAAASHAQTVRTKPLLSTPPLLSSALCILAAMQLWGITLIWQYNVSRLAPLLASSAADVLTPARMWPLVADSYKQNGKSPDPSTRRWIYANMPRGGLLISTVSELQGLLYDWRYSFAVEYRTPAQRELWQDQTQSLSAGADRAQIWLNEITSAAAGRPLMVLCYTNSTEDRALAAASSFTMAYEQPGNLGVFPVRVYLKNQ